MQAVSASAAESATEQSNADQRFQALEEMMAEMKTNIAEMKNQMPVVTGVAEVSPFMHVWYEWL